MNTQSQDNTTGFAWSKTDLNAAKEWATALGAGTNHRLFYGGYDGTNANFYGRSSDNKSWEVLIGPFADPVNSICSDGKGTIYFVGPKTSTGQFALFAYYENTGELPVIPGSGQQHSIDSVCTDGLGNVYITGKFNGPNGHPVVMQ